MEQVNNHLMNVSIFMNILKIFSYSDVLNMFKLKTEHTIQSFPGHSSDLFHGLNPDGYELFIIPNSVGTRLGGCILLHNNQCIYYMHRKYAVASTSKISMDSLEIYHRTDSIKDISLYDPDLEQTDKHKSVKIDLNTYDSDVHFNSLLWMNLPDYEQTQICIEFYKNNYAVSKSTEFNIIISNKFIHDMEKLNTLTIPTELVEKVQYLLQDYDKRYSYEVMAIDKISQMEET